MSAFTGDQQLSAAGVDQGHRAFQEFLLAGERHIVAGLARGGAEESFARVYGGLPGTTQATLAGYFRRQSQLDLSQRAGLLGPFTKLNIADALSHGIIRRIAPPPAAIRSELDSVGDRRFEGRGSAFSTIKGMVADAITDASTVPVKPVRPPKFAVRFVDLLLDEIVIEDSQDYVWLLQNDTDEVTLGVTMINEKAEVTTASHNLGSIKEGRTLTYENPLTLGSMPVDIGISGFPRTFSFKVDAVDRDEGGYNDALAAGADYLQDKITEELIALGIIRVGQAVNIPIPPWVANYIASYVKTWFDEFIDWFANLIRNNDDVLGSRQRAIQLAGWDFEITEWTWLGIRTIQSARGPLQTRPFTWTFSGSDGRWRTKMRIQLR